jgi:starch phosphorylase
MEIGIDSRIPTYCGGLGILAGDLAYSFADMSLPATFVTLLSRNGYASQKLDAIVGQVDSSQPWDWQRILARTGAVVGVEIGDRTQKVGAWEYKIQGGAEVSLLFLDTDFPENDAEVRAATERLYGGEPSHRLIQDIILGVGGYRVLKALGRSVEVYHLNESHAAFAIVELLRDAGEVGAARRKCVFTTHTPIPAGNDVFPSAAVKEALKKYPWMNWDEEMTDGSLNLSKLAARYSGVTNAVSLKSKFVSKGVVGHDIIATVTNGVYHRRWVHEELKRLFDRHIAGWEESPSLMARAMGIPSEELARAHEVVKRILVSTVNDRTGLRFADDSFTVSVAKRIASYKRNGMILGDPGRLERIATERGDLQIVIAGKAHPRDDVAKAMIADMIRKAKALNEGSRRVKVAVLADYDIDLAKILVAGSDLWLNNPRRPLEACGTSGMKAAMNGVLNLSVYDGWWLEGGIESVNGWGIGRRTEWADLSESPDKEDENDLFSKLSDQVLPLYYRERGKWMEMAKASIATVGPLFNSYRMVEDYVTRVYSVAAAEV